MASLIWIQPKEEPRTFSLGEGTLILGRSAEANIRVIGTSVSGNHASIVHAKGEWIVRDNGSTNGTFVNGKQIERRPLRHHDVISLGDVTLLVDLGESALSESTAKPVVNAPEVNHPEPQDEKKSDTKRGQSLPEKPGRMAGFLKVWSSGFLALLLIPLTVWLTLYALPLPSREAMAASEEFKSIPGHDLLQGLVFFRTHTDNTKVDWLKNASFTSRMSVPQSVRLNGRLSFDKEPSEKFTIKIFVKSGEDPNPWHEEVVEIAAGVKTAELFSIMLRPGTYVLECTCQEGPTRAEIPSNLQLLTQY